MASDSTVTLSSKEYNKLIARQGSTTLTGVQLIVMLTFVPLVFAMIVLGVRFIWSATSNTALLEDPSGFIAVFAIIGTPVSAGFGYVFGAFQREAGVRAGGGKPSAPQEVSRETETDDSGD